ncbi:MAG: hypothetical protein ABSD68_04260 [Candidatus Micrarchaeales archaeon]|jgi:hypothetical protein
MFDSATLAKEDSRRTAKKKETQSQRTTEYTGGGCFDANLMPIRDRIDTAQRKADNFRGGCFDAELISVRDSYTAKRLLKKAERQVEK